MSDVSRRRRTVLFRVSTHVASIYADLLEQKKAFAQEKSSTRRYVWDPNLANVSLFWNTNMAALKSCENPL